jgi:hypothetical protein
MPVKRRHTKRRMTPEAELDAWRDVFDSGFDLFGDAEELTGLVEPCHIRFDADRAEGERLWREAASDAWARLGGLFLTDWRGDGVPWAAEQFGRPWEATNAG